MKLNQAATRIQRWYKLYRGKRLFRDLLKKQTEVLQYRLKEQLSEMETTVNQVFELFLNESTTDGTLRKNYSKLRSQSNLEEDSVNR